MAKIQNQLDHVIYTTNPSSVGGNQILCAFGGINDCGRTGRLTETKLTWVDSAFADATGGDVCADATGGDVFADATGGDVFADATDGTDSAQSDFDRVTEVDTGRRCGSR